jgi:glycosyltransferase involved in cell wall biosynthesis
VADPVRLLTVTQASELGGAEYALLRIARHLPEHGFRVVLTTPGDGAVAEAARREGIEVHRLPVGGLPAGRWPRALAALPRARALLRRLRPSLVHFNGTVAQRLAPAFAGTRLVPHVHDLLAATPRPWRSRRFWRLAPIVLCDSDAVADRAAELGAPRERLRTVYCPVDAAEPAPRPEWATGSPVVGFVGRVEPRKGVLELLEAVGRLGGPRLVLVGEDELGASASYARAVHERAAALGERATLLGRVPDAARLMPWFDVLAVPSREEPFGTVAAEALAAGTPVVASDVGGLREYVDDGCGALVPPGDPGALADALAGVLRRAPEMAEAARRAAAPFRSHRVAARAAEALREALEA